MKRKQKKGKKKQGKKEKCRYLPDRGCAITIPKPGTDLKKSIAGRPNMVSRGLN